MVSERPWVRVPVRPHSFSAPVTFDCSVWARAWAASSNLKETLVGSGMAPSSFGEASN